MIRHNWYWDHSLKRVRTCGGVIYPGMKITTIYRWKWNESAIYAINLCPLSYKQRKQIHRAVFLWEIWSRAHSLRLPFVRHKVLLCAVMTPDWRHNCLWWPGDLRRAKNSAAWKKGKNNKHISCPLASFSIMLREPYFINEEFAWAVV